MICFLRVFLCLEYEVPICPGVELSLYYLILNPLSPGDLKLVPFDALVRSEPWSYRVSMLQSLTGVKAGLGEIEKMNEISSILTNSQRACFFHSPEYIWDFLALQSQEIIKLVWMRGLVNPHSSSCFDHCHSLDCFLCWGMFVTFRPVMPTVQEVNEQVAQPERRPLPVISQDWNW